MQFCHFLLFAFHECVKEKLLSFLAHIQSDAIDICSALYSLNQRTDETEVAHHTTPTVNNLPDFGGALGGCTKPAAVETFMFSLHVKLDMEGDDARQAAACVLLQDCRVHHLHITQPLSHIHFLELFQLCDAITSEPQHLFSI